MSLKLILGPMYRGKSFELITQLDFRFKHAEIQNAKILIPPITLRKMKPENIFLHVKQIIMLV